MHTIKSGNLVGRCSFAGIKSYDKSNEVNIHQTLLPSLYFFGTAASFIDKICSSVTEAKREVFLFFYVYSEVNSTSKLTNQNAQKALFTCVVYDNSLVVLNTTTSVNYSVTVVSGYSELGSESSLDLPSS